MVKMLGLSLHRFIKSEKGMAPILVLFLLVVAIMGGTYLVQNRTHINPFAAVTVPTIPNIVEVKVGDCSNHGGNSGTLELFYRGTYNGCPTEGSILYTSRFANNRYECVIEKRQEYYLYESCIRQQQQSAPQQQQPAPQQQQPAPQQQQSAPQQQQPAPQQQQSAPQQQQPGACKSASTALKDYRPTEYDQITTNGVTVQIPKCDSKLAALVKALEGCDQQWTNVPAKVPDSLKGCTIHVALKQTPSCTNAGCTCDWDKTNFQVQCKSTINPTATGNGQVFDPAIMKCDGKSIVTKALGKEPTGWSRTCFTTETPDAKCTEYKNQLLCSDLTGNDLDYCQGKDVCAYAENNQSRLGIKQSDGSCKFEQRCVQTYREFNNKYYKIGSQVESNAQNEEDEKSDEEEAAQNALYQKCGFTKNEQGIPIYAVAIGENQNINDPECKDLIEKQTQYFGNKMEKARQKAEELAKQNKLKYQQGVFVPEEGLSEEEQETAKKKADELNKTVAPAIKQAEIAQGDCEGKTGQEKANCLKNVQDPVQKVMDETQKQVAKGALDKLNQILDGKKPGGCVKADLNLTPHLEAKRLKARGRGKNPDPADGGEANDKGRRTFHRLLICAGKNKQDWKWRVLVGGNSGSEFANDGEDKGNDAERLYGLYGTDESYDGPPQFGSGFAINRCVTLTGNTPDTIRKDLAVYIKAAESGQSPTAPGGGPCKAEPNKEDTGGGDTSPSGDDGDDKNDDKEDDDDTNPSDGDDKDDDKPGTDGGKTNRCSSDEGCQKKNDPLHRKGTYKCDKSNGQCYLAS